MNEYILLYSVKLELQGKHKPTGNTRHFGGGALLPDPVELRIIQYADDPGFYLFYCDENGKEQTDTYHDSVEGAMDQAEWELNVQPEDWTPGTHDLKTSQA
jgi:hypothetical protein